MRAHALALTCLVALGCGDDAPSTTHDSGPPDANMSMMVYNATTCANLRQRWIAGAGVLDRACRVAEDCRLMGSPRGMTCNCTPSVFGGCGFAVAKAQFPPSIDDLEDEWYAHCTQLDNSNICDCGPQVADCVNSRCAARERVSCLGADAGTD